MKPVPLPPETPVEIFRVFRAGLLEPPLIVPGDRVQAACSGGPDSVALVSLLMELREEIPIDIVVAHFDHRLRPESGDDEAFVRELCRRHCLPFVGGAADVRAYAATRRLNLEEAARELRYRFLRREAGRLGTTKIATGHTMNDQAETVLMRLMRGAGLAGLSGIHPVQAGGGCPVVRPLLGLTRRRLLVYLQARGERFRIDATNLDRGNLRSRIRVDLIPALEKGFESRIVEHLARLASLVRQEDELLTEFVRELNGAFFLRKGRQVVLDREGLPPRLPALSRRVLREFIREVRGDLRAVSFGDVEAVLGLKDGKERALPGGPTLLREGAWIKVKGKAMPARPFRILWDGKGRLDVEAAEMTFEGRRRKATARATSRRNDAGTAVLDASKLVFPLVVRSRRPGDIYRPFGAPGRKKLKEILRARGVVRGARDRLPVFLSGDEIIWVPGLPIADRFKVTPKTRTVFIIEKTEADQSIARVRGGRG